MMGFDPKKHQDDQGSLSGTAGTGAGTNTGTGEGAGTGTGTGTGAGTGTGTGPAAGAGTETVALKGRLMHKHFYMCKSVCIL